MNVLSEIIETKKREVTLLLESGIADESGFTESGASFIDAVRKPGDFPLSLIAEVKKASPSKGVIRGNFNPVEIANCYKTAGASAVSVLTDRDYFSGDILYLKEIRNRIDLPLLRKDFIIDKIQLEEARLFGASAVLLIVAALDAVKLEALIRKARELNMDSLVEVHNETEVKKALNAGAEIIGINNRDLSTFKTDLAVTEKLRPLIPCGKVVVSESGIHTNEDIVRLAELDIQAVLIGEALMAAPDIGGKIKELFCVSG